MVPPQFFIIFPFDDMKEGTLELEDEITYLTYTSIKTKKEVDTKDERAQYQDKRRNSSGRSAEKSERGGSSRGKTSGSGGGSSKTAGRSSGGGSTKTGAGSSRGTEAGTRAGGTTAAGCKPESESGCKPESADA